METLEKQNALLMQKIDALAAGQAAAKAALPDSNRPAKPGHTWTKMRVLDSDGDLNWGMVELPNTDKRVKSGSASLAPASKNEAGRGNPMLEQKVGPNDVVVTGV